jgi:hypothetical protein
MGHRTSGIADPGAVGLVVRAGRKAFISWLGGRCRSIAATDLYVHTSCSNLHIMESHDTVLTDPRPLDQGEFAVERLPVVHRMSSTRPRSQEPRRQRDGHNRPKARATCEVHR